MGLFWVGVQQFCFTCLKNAYDQLIMTAKTGRLLTSQLLVFALLLLFCFEGEFTGLDFFWHALRIGEVEYYEWTVRVFLCGAMILFDALLVLYFARVVRLHRYGRAAERPTLKEDLAVFAFVALLSGGYLVASIAASVHFRFYMEEYNWIGRFFIQISNFFYIALEIGGAILAWSFLRELVRRRDFE